MNLAMTYCIYSRIKSISHVNIAICYGRIYLACSAFFVSEIFLAPSVGYTEVRPLPYMATRWHLSIKFIVNRKAKMIFYKSHYTFY